MKALILAAGYGTRLQRDLANDTSGEFNHLIGCPKPLLPIGHDPLVTHWLKLLSSTPDITSVHIVTNDSSYAAFQSWAKDWKNVSLFSDGTRTNEGRVGAVGCIELSIKEFDIQDDLMIIAGDTLFYNNFNVGDVISTFKNHQATNGAGNLVTYVNCPDKDVHKYGILETDDNGRVVNFLEKPSSTETTSRKQCPCFYLLSKDSLPLISQFLEEKKEEPLQSRDATGNFISYLYTRAPIYTMELSGRFDVGGLESYKVCHDYFLKSAK